MMSLFSSIFSTFWSFISSLGIKSGVMTFLLLILASALIVLYVKLNNAYNKIKELEKEKEELRAAQFTNEKCAFLQNNENCCPLGLIKIYDKAKDTLRSSLERPEKKFHWFGLSAFNVIHNNLDSIRSKGSVSYVFSIQNPENAQAQKLTDKYYNNADDKLGTKGLTTTMRQIIRDAKPKLNNVKVQYYDLLPTFRLAIIDDAFVQVSFYQRGGDILERPQLEFSIDKNNPLSIGTWLLEFYEIMTNWNKKLTQTSGKTL